MSPERRIQALVELAAAARPPGAIRDALLRQLAATSGLHPSSVGRLADLWLESIDRATVTRWAEAMTGLKPCASAGVVAPGNLFVATWTAMLEPWLLGCDLIVRASTRDPIAPDNLRAGLALIRPDAAGTIEVRTFERDDDHAWQRFFADADAIAGYGSDEALRSIASKNAASGTAIRKHGHKVSVGYLDAAGWRNLASKPETCRAIAHDALLADGRGCMSLRSLIVEGDPRANPASIEAIAEAFQDAAAELPAGAIGIDEAAGRRMAIETLRTLEAFGADVAVRDLDDAWLLVDARERDTITAPFLGPGARALTIVRGPAPERLNDYFAPLDGHLSTLATDDGRLLPSFDRGCVFGRTQAPHIWRDPDGYPVGRVFAA